MTEIRINCRINPTESREKLRRALSNLFGDIELVEDDDAFTANLDDLLKLRELRSRIAQDKIRSTLNRVLSRWADGEQLSFGLNRQAAYAGHVSLNLENEDPMGPIQVTINGNLEKVVEFLTT